MAASTFPESQQMVPSPIQREDLHYQRQRGPTMMRLWARPSQFLSNGTLARLSLTSRRWIRQKQHVQFSKVLQQKEDLIYSVWWDAPIARADLLGQRGSPVNQASWFCLTIRQRVSLRWLVLSRAAGHGLIDRQAKKQPALEDHNSLLLPTISLWGMLQVCLGSVVMIPPIIILQSSLSSSSPQ